MLNTTPFLARVGSLAAVMAGVSGVSQIAGGGQGSCAIQDGRARCWGLNADVGDGTTTERLEPVDVLP